MPVIVQAQAGKYVSIVNESPIILSMYIPRPAKKFMSQVLICVGFATKISACRQRIHTYMSSQIRITISLFRFVRIINSVSEYVILLIRSHCY